VPVAGEGKAVPGEALRRFELEADGLAALADLQQLPLVSTALPAGSKATPVRSTVPAVPNPEMAAAGIVVPSICKVPPPAKATEPANAPPACRSSVPPC